eukprot:gene961-1084_t
MYTNGTLRIVHRNGRINYLEQEETRADGASINCERALLASKQVEDANTRLEELKSQLAQLSDGDETKQKLVLLDIERAEEAVEEALERLLEAEGVDENKSGGDQDESDDSDDSGTDGVIKTLGDPLVGEKRRPGGEAKYSTTCTAPLNFSRVDTTLSEPELERLFPLYADSIRRRPPLEVTLCAGEMLYIPAGWFHEVHSLGPPPLGHMALNYWFHPPDNDSFHRPYSSDFWPTDWRRRMANSERSNSTTIG